MWPPVSWEVNEEGGLSIERTSDGNRRRQEESVQRDSALSLRLIDITVDSLSVVAQVLDRIIPLNNRDRIEMLPVSEQAVQRDSAWSLRLIDVTGDALSLIAYVLDRIIPLS